MKKRGTVRFQVSGLSMEKLLNEAGRKGIRLRNVQRGRYRDVAACLTPDEYERFRELALEKGYQVSEPIPAGAFKAWERHRKRWGLPLGAAIAAALLIWALGSVWTVRVENAGPYAGEIRSYLLENGIRPGIRRAGLSLSVLRDKLEWRFPQVKWIRTEFAGTALRIIVEEGTPPPQIADQGGPGDVVAAQDGLLLRLNTFAGTPQAKPGQWVRAGQVLIRGEERGKDGETLPVKARGEALARVWVSERVRFSTREYESIPTGSAVTLRRITGPFFQWSSGDKPDYALCDLEKSETPIGGVWFPILCEKETYAEVSTRPVPRDLNQLALEAGEAAWLRLKETLIHDEIVDKWMNFSIIEEDTMEAAATAEVRRDIARFRKE